MADHVALDMDGDGGVDPEPQFEESAALRPTPEEALRRAAIAKELDALAAGGAFFRMPRPDTPLPELEKRLAELKERAKKAAEKPKAKPKAKAKPKDKPKDKDDDKDDGLDYPPESPRPRLLPHQRGKTPLHMMYYAGVTVAGRALEYSTGVEEMGNLGQVARANQPAIDPVLDELAADWGLGSGAWPPEVTLALMTGTMAASCYVAATPESPLRSVVELAGVACSLNLAAAAKARAAVAPPSNVTL
jgi:hypothetical protein